MTVKAYDQKLRDKVLRLHLEEGRTIASLSKEYGIGKSTIGAWVTSYRKAAATTPSKQSVLELQTELKELRKKVEAAEKE